MPTKAKSAAPRKRRSPISRAEGEQRLIKAATQLVRERPFSEVGVRDIALVADVNHGFVHTWFGSKNDLLLAVVKDLIQGMAKRIEESPPGAMALDPNDPDVSLVIRLSMWLDLEGVPTSTVLDELAIATRLTERYIEVEHLDPKIARTAALQAVSLAIATSTFSKMLTEEIATSTTEVFGLWRHILGLLAKYPPA